METSLPDSKILFRVLQPDGSVDVETLWAKALGEDLYRILNSPFHVYGVSWKDVVYAPYDPVEERAAFVRIVEKGGHRTVRVIFDPPADAGTSSRGILDQLVALGVSYEGATSSYVAIDIPPDVELAAICDVLTRASIQWEHADPTYEEIYGDACSPSFA